eukprot:CAMPEP_0178910380 /NCGR_PEP_ID=MMETSP0786-20121207/9067_1 /TAXON_ID=186022 /ORGANISM="Thalassionema frauenfeldii, Strain CCMP 1798" /LENGTH=610 /DNA_ID=CAMNT_0020582629 /DNA_START=89 /DNA_END=1918 /DNA_ORIENTATION=+
MVFQMEEPNIKLVFNDFNIVVLTDVHSWVAGHVHQEPHLDADYGDVLSFYERLRDLAASSPHKQHDLWFVSNGDFVHGTGLGAPEDPSHLIPILEKMPWDAVNCGNHELYDDVVVEYMTRPGGWVDWWGERYLTANVRRVDGNLLGNEYRILTNDYNEKKLLVFGFLYNMSGASELIQIDQVEDVVKSKWFQTAASLNDIDGILVLAHMDLQDPLVDVIRKALRKYAGDTMPIQFITGHTHYRGTKTLDDYSVSFEAGRYLDTIGFVSFPSQESIVSGSSSSSSSSSNNHSTTEELFQNVFIDGSKQALAETLGLTDNNELPTEHGQELTEMIAATRDKMGLTKEIGCAPQSYYLKKAIDAPASLWGLYRDEVIPKTTFFDGSVLLLQTEVFRYDLLSHAPLIRDDILAVAPFNDTVVRVEQTVLGSTILQLNAMLNDKATYMYPLPNFVLIGTVEPEQDYDLYVHDFNVKQVVAELQKLLPPGTNFDPVPTPYTSTKIWLSYVQQYWPCPGKSSILPDWIPTPKSIAEKMGKEDDSTTTMTVSIVMGIILGVIGLVLVRLVYLLLRYLCCSGYTTLTPEELDVFTTTKVNNTNGEYDDTFDELSAEEEE